MATITVDVWDKAGTLYSSETGISWAWFDADPALGTAAIEGGTGELISAGGELQLSSTLTALTSGQTAFILLYQSTTQKVGYYELLVD